MFIRYRTKGLIFKKENLGENNQILKIYTEDFGMIEILAKGIKKISSKLRSQTEIFCFSEIEFIQGKTYKTLTDAVLIEKFNNLKKSLKKLSLTYKISEVLDTLIKCEEKDEKIWELLLTTFKTLDSPSIDSLTCTFQYYYFFWKLISFLGYGQKWDSCIICQSKLSPSDLYFNERKGGIICQNCYSLVKKGKKITPRLLKILRKINERDFKSLKKMRINQKEMLKLKEISENYLKFLKEKYYATENF